MALDDTPETPDWWLIREGRRLRARLPRLDWWWRYYSGDHPLPQGPRKAVQAYLDFQKMSRTNFCRAVVGATVNRSSVIGINGPGGENDPQAWEWWRLNKLNARQAGLYRIALSQSVGYVMVGEHPREDGRPLATIEHPRQVIHEDDPETGEVRVAAKFWYDDVLRRGRANLYERDRTVKYVTGTRGPGPLPVASRSSWERMETEDAPDGVLDHGYGLNPVVPFECRPDPGEDPTADFDQVISIQDRINLGVLNRMTAERYSAFRQKYVTGHKFRKRLDPATGLEVVEQPFVPDPGGVWASEGEKTHFGEFSQTELTGYLKSHEADVRDLLILSNTPGYYYATELINIATDTVAALDVNHVAKVQELSAGWGEGWETVTELCAMVADASTTGGHREVRWRDPRQLNPNALADMAVKLQTAGYPLAIIAEMTGEGPERIQAITAAAAGQNLLAAALNPPAPAAPAADRQLTRTGG